MLNILTDRTKRIDAYLQHDLKNTNQRMQREFAYFSANVYSLLPHIPQRDYLSLFNQLQANRMLSDLDIEQACAMQVHGWDASYASALQKRPGIICTFHTGSYRFLNLLLAHAGTPLSLVVAGDVLKQEKETFENRFEPAAQHIGIKPDIDFINASLPSSLISMARAAKQGRCLLVYLDGNTGSGDAENTGNLLTLPFCAGQLRVRKGTAVLAYRLGLPLYPIICTRKATGITAGRSNHLLYRQLAPLLPLQGEDEAAYAARATATLYAMLAEVAGLRPYEWEGWLNVHAS
ncbi:hypothetical protein GCM10007415_39910 [Parapedobacter pyrenivorans]|uniref:Lauroyl/myristoyl acyltransferase n=1 Tax=Parapedobacter pyrenivorans TaxID=1305674 RepID=A0A917I0R5_9SPHI|nr:hypothetical protein [Parapedobacter pyrenivorans]GGH00043.1 hypothetical protein GCM10007415_39910 [Parapedobacter pyrenivorans]